MIRPFFFACLLLLARPLWAHPHIFVDTSIEVFTDEKGRLTHLEVTWAYDAFYSLLITEEYRLDSDGDAVLTPGEKAMLNGFDMAWVPDFNGDLVATVDGQEVALSGPRDFTTDMIEGRIVTTHVRDVADLPLLAGATLVLTPFDGTYYTAYDVTYPVKVAGDVLCDVRKVVPELDDQMVTLRAALAELSAQADPADVGLPNAGGDFATRVEVTCSAQ